MDRTASVDLRNTGNYCPLSVSLIIATVAVMTTTFSLHQGRKYTLFSPDFV